MSTRCNVHFCNTRGEIESNVYRHYDGYPDTVLQDLQRFFQDVRSQCPRDTRFNDAEYLAAKYLVWEARAAASDPNKPLAFLGFGICLEDHGDIEFVYDVICGNNDQQFPTVKSREVH